jgi:serine/threonine-protein kinase
MYQIGDEASAPASLGRYQLLEKIDSGGMGAIYLARLAGAGGFEKLVVLKVLLPELAESERFRAMFLDEARIAARLSHPNICEVYELGEDRGRHFIAMQYLRGVDFTTAMRRPEGTEPAAHVRLIASLIAQAAEGLHHAHQLRDAGGLPLGIVHRDVSPPNLFVTVDGVAKVLDFGIAKARDIESKTRRDEIKGKQSYMSPEQLAGESLDGRSDVFSLGVVLYEGMTGSRLFHRDTDYLVARAILEDPIDDPRQREPAIAAGLAEVAERALARRREDRFASARDLADALAAAIPPGPMLPARIGEAIASGFDRELRAQEDSYRRATAVARRLAAPEGGPEAAIDTEIDTAPGRQQRRRRRWIAPLAAAATIAAIAAGAWRLSERSAASGRADHDAGPIAVAAADAGATPTAPLPDAAPVAPDAAAEPSVVPAPRYGYVSIDSSPYATIYIDGRRAGVTPLIRYRVRAGKRRVRAVLESGQSRRFSIAVEAGELAPPRQLRW